MTRALLQQALDALIASYKDIEFHLSRTKSLDEKDACVARILEQVDAINALRAALAEPQQPVAWLSESGDWSTTSPSIRDHHVSKGKVMIPLYK